MSAIAGGGLRARNLRTLAALAALFLVPLVIAFCTYYGTAWRPSAHVNHGQLISPPRPLPAVALPRIVLTSVPELGTLEVGTPGDAAQPFHKHWSLVYVGAGDCAADCRAALYVMRQTRLALNTDMTRVARVFLVTGECCDRTWLGREHPGLQLLDASAPAAQPLLAQFPAAARAHTLFIVDPLGNLMMSFDTRADPHGLLEDLKKLLALSHIG